MADYTPLTPIRPAAGDDISLTTFYDIVDANFQNVHDLCVRLITNNTGGTVSRGYVGVLSTAATDSLLATTTAGDTRLVAVVIAASIGNGSTGYVAVGGLVGTVNVNGAVVRGDLLKTHTSAGYSRSGNSGGFAVALTTNASGNGTVAAYIHNTPPLPWSRQLAFR